MHPFDGLYLNAGAMKAGTTWLYRQLEQHPAIVFSREKELHYHASRAGDRRALDLRYRLTRARNALQRDGVSPVSAAGRELLRWYLPYVLVPPRSNRWYRARFPTAVPAGGYCADFSNLTAVIDEAGWSNIRGLAARPRISIVLRQPLERVWSHLKFLRRLGTSQAAPESLSVAEIDALDARYGLWRHSQYSQSLAQIQRHFEPGQVKVLLYDDIASRPLALLRELEAFLGIAAHDYQQNKLERRINVSSGHDMPAVVIERFAAELETELAALQALGVVLPAAWS